MDKEIARLLKDDLAQVNSLILKLSKSELEISQNIITHIISSGGKRLRPILTLLSSKMFGFEGYEHIRLAVAIEFLHTATLLHDDVVDESKTRRGKTTANNIWGNKVSILVGDFMLSKAFQQMALSNNIDIICELSNASVTITEGEVKQLVNIANMNLSMEEYLKIISAKTAPLFSCAMAVGGILTGQNTQTINALRSFGENLGILFQIIDDSLDYFGNEKETGKKVGGDFFEGKITLPFLIATKNSKEKEKLFNCITNITNTKSLEDILKIFEENKVRKACDTFAMQYYNKAKDAILNLPDNPYKQSILDILDFSFKRVG